MIVPYGRDGVLVDLQIATSPLRALLTRSAAAALKAAFPDADVVVGGGVVALFGVGSVPHLMERAQAALAIPSVLPGGARLHAIHAVYDGPDLRALSEQCGMRDADEVVALHTASEYVAELLGFLPGFAYLAGLHPRLVVPRRTVPRPRVAAGSVALAGEFSAVYPWDSPGGWHLLGRVVRVDNELVADTGNLECGSSAPCGALGILPGDRVQFFPMRAQDAGPAAPRLRPLAPDAPGAGLVVEQTALSATVQDQGRSGQLARGLPPSGPLDPDTFARAQAAVGNAPTHAAIEVWRGTLTVRARGSVVVSADGSPPRQLRDGERLSIGSPQGLSYLAVLGGVEVPLCAGSRATLVVARWGGFAGRSLRVGDVVPVADQPRAEPNEPGFPSGFNPCPALLSQLSCDKGVPIVIDPGPHLDRFPSGELERFVSSKFIVSASSDRVGQRLEGTRVPRTGGDLALPTPMTRGAVQVTTDGTPIVLGPDHPTTGGYPVIGVVRRTSWGALAHKTPGEVVRFTLG